MKQKLFEDFKEVSAKEWKQNIQYELKGADYNQKLVWESPEGIKVKPFYHADDTQLHTTSHKAVLAPWKITQHIVVKDITLANKSALSAIKGGAESILFTLPSVNVDFKSLLANIDYTSISIHCQFESALTGDVERFANSTQIEKEYISFHISPIGQLASTGNWFINMGRVFKIRIPF
ncbi:hypothetical protein ACU8V7_15100 [Zobellia nedashkovskayae]